MRVWPFEGRCDELAVIETAFASPAVNAVVLSGSAGVGKTRLARQALRRLPCRRTDWIMATHSGATIPFGALAHLLPDLAGPGFGPVEAMRAICSHVSGWGGRTRVALGIDDAHLLDHASAATVAHVVTRSAAFVIMTARSGEPLPDALTRLCKDDLADTLIVAPLPDGVVDRLIDHSRAGRIDTLERRRLRRAAQGNPLAQRELLHGAVAGGLTDLVTSRLDALSTETRTVVELVACGEPVPLTMLEQLADPGAVGAAEDSGLVVVETDGRRTQARLAHPVYGEVLRSRLPLSRTRQLCANLAAQMLSTPLRRRDDVLRAALWQVDSGTITRLDVVRDGARLATGRTGLALAERLARAAREAEPGPEADRLLAEILEYQGRSAEAAALLPVVPPTERSERIRWAVTRADWLYWGCGDLSAAEDVLGTMAGQPAAEGALAFILFFAGRCAEAARIAGGVLRRDDSDPQAQVWAAAAATASLGFLGHLEEAQAVRASGREVAEAHSAALPWAAFQIEIAACLAHLAAGRPDEAARIAATGYQTALETGAPMMVSGWALYRGIVAGTQGDLNRADQLFAEALTGFEQNDTFRLRRCCLAAHAWVSAMRGQDRAAAALMARADQLDNDTNHVFSPWIATWQAWVARACGDTTTAVHHAVRGAEIAAGYGMPCVEAMARYDVVRLGGTTDLTRMAALPGSVPPVLTAAARVLAKASAVDLEPAAHALAGLGYHLHGAELATAAAQALRRAGHRGRAGLAAAAAADVRARCPGARTPLLAHDGLGALLTTREQQIALLATRHPSKEIAQRLGLAVATVNNNLARAYVKLGVNDRAQLRALLTREDDQAGRRMD
jgi:DNA-binding CsgD family transcriptional regulator